MRRVLAAFMAAVLIFTTSCKFDYQDVLAEKENEVVTLSVLFGQSSTDAGLQDMIDEALAAEHPDIKLEWECVDWGDRFGPQMTLKFATGDIPDIIICKAQDISTYVTSKYIAAIPDDYKRYVVDESLSAVTIDGSMYGFSYNMSYQGVLYNKDIFMKYGYEIPKTKAELDMLVQTMKVDGITPYASHFQEIWYIGNMSMQFAMNEVFNLYPDWGDRFRSGSVSFADSEEFKEIYADCGEILANTWPDALSVDQMEADSRFADSRAAMYVTGSWSLQTIENVNPGMNVGIFPFPNEEGDAKLIFEPNMSFMKSALSKHEEEIDTFFEFMLTNKNLAEEIINFTKTASMLKDIAPAFPEAIQKDINDHIVSSMITDVTLGNTQIIWNFQEDCAKQVFLYLQGKSSLEEVLEYADRNRHKSIS